MDLNHKKIKAFLLSRQVAKLLQKSRHGLEKESLRVLDGRLSQASHPRTLGHPLTHPWISTDFAEPQLELITPVFHSESAVLKFLEKLHVFIVGGIGREFLWPLSMPCELPKNEKDIPIAQYGSSYEGQKRFIYRKGLSLRYGRRMQTISGTHYNFSFAPEFWDSLMDFSHAKESRKDFIAGAYLHMIRNALRFGWLATYLFGASPAVDASYLPKGSKHLKPFGKRSFSCPDATSIRLSELGYYSKVQTQHSISCNTLNEYLADLTYAISTPKKSYTTLGVFKNGEQLQLNDHILQFEAEHYSRARVKPFRDGEDSIEAFRKYGIQYIELRSLDLDPFEPIGIGLEQLQFLHIFLIACLVWESPPFDREEMQSITTHQNRVALCGRDPKLKIRSRATRLLDQMMFAAEVLDAAFGGHVYRDVLNHQKEKVSHPEATLSAKILSEMIQNKDELLSFGMKWAKIHTETLRKKTLSPSERDRFEKEAQISLQKEKELSERNDLRLPGQEDLELSTQILMREALRRKIEIEVIDRKESLVRFTKGAHEHYVQKASETAADSYVTYLLMNNKHATKVVLERARVRVPRGEMFYTLGDALRENTGPRLPSPGGQAAASVPQPFSLPAGRQGRGSHRRRRLRAAGGPPPRHPYFPVVVKPKSTNYGTAVHFVDRHDQKGFEAAVRDAFRYGDSILVEEYIAGEEYRFLVVGNKVASIVQRIPAHVIGDGKHSIEELIRIKNHAPLPYYRPSKYRIHFGGEEKEFLKAHDFSGRSTPKKGRRVFLRQNSNVSTGGDVIEMTDKVHEGYKRVAEKAAAAIGSRLTGIDMIIANPKLPPTDANHAVIEVNHNPALFIHCLARRGEHKNVAAKVLDLLGFY